MSDDLRILRHKYHRLMGATITLFVLTLWGWLI